MRLHDRKGGLFTARGLANLGCLAFLLAGLVALLYSRSYPTRYNAH
jgi:hypothetical protein